MAYHEQDAAELRAKIRELDGSRQIHIYLSTPVHGWEIGAGWFAFFEDLRQACELKGIKLQANPRFGTSDLVKTRNLDAHDFLKSGATHLLTFDSDQYASPHMILRMLRTGPSLCAAPVPKKTETGPKSEWFNFLTEPGEQVRNGDYLRVAAVGTGCMLATRQCILETVAIAGKPFLQ